MERPKCVYNAQVKNISLETPCYCNGHLHLCCTCSFSIEWNVTRDNIEIFKQKIQAGMELDAGNLYLNDLYQPDYLSNNFLEVLQRIYKKSWYNNPRRNRFTGQQSTFFQPPSLLDLSRWKIRAARDSIPANYQEKIPNKLIDLINLKDL